MMRAALRDHAPHGEVRVVHAHWDDAAKVWWAKSDDIPGLVSEAPTFEQLVDNISALVPDLLELNGQPDGAVPIEVQAHRMLRLEPHAA